MRGNLARAAPWPGGDCHALHDPHVQNGPHGPHGLHGLHGPHGPHGLHGSHGRYSRRVRHASGSIAGALLAGALAATSPAPAAAQAQAPTTGLLQARAAIVSGCRVSGQEQADSGIDFGTLDFGAHPSLFPVPLTAQAQGANGVVRLACSGVVSASVAVGTGGAPLGNQRRLSNGLHRIPYQLYADANYNTPFTGTSPQTVLVPGGGGAAQVDLPIYGRIEPVAGGYPAGHYADQVQVTVSW